MRELTERNPCEDRGCDCCLHFREAWTAGSIYRPGEAVPYNGSSYVALHLNQNDPPPSGNWALIASKGDAGPAGPAGAVGPQGPAGQVVDAGGNDVFATQSFLDPGQGAFDPGGVEFAALLLPSGSYVVLTTFVLHDFDQDDQSWTVELHNGDSIVSTAIGRLGSGRDSTVTIMSPFVATSDSTARISLLGFGFNIKISSDPAQPFNFLAMRVGAIHTS